MSSNNYEHLTPTIAQYANYDELLKHSEQVPLHEFQVLENGKMPRFAEGLFDQPPGPGLQYVQEWRLWLLNILNN